MTIFRQPRFVSDSNWYSDSGKASSEIFPTF